MTTRDIIGLAIVSVVAVVLIIIAILLLLGKGSSLIAGYNTSDDKEKYTIYVGFTLFILGWC